MSDPFKFEEFITRTLHHLPPEFPAELWAGTISTKGAALASALATAEGRSNRVKALVDLNNYTDQVASGLRGVRAYLDALDKEQIPAEAKAGFADVEFHLQLSVALLVTYIRICHDVAFFLRSQGG
jgi:hypothetical protein